MIVERNEIKQEETRAGKNAASATAARFIARGAVNVYPPPASFYFELSLRAIIV